MADAPAPNDPNRRLFVAVVATGTCAMAAAVAIPGAAFVGAPAFAEKGRGGRRFRVGSLDDFAIGDARRVSIVGDEVDAFTRAEKRRLGAVWLLRTGPREVRAWSAICPHLGCSIDKSGSGFGCPCHDSAFDATGARASGPSPRGMDPLPLEIAPNGDLTVTWTRYRIGVAGQEEIG